MMVTGSSICGRSMLGPKTVARFWTLILLTFEWDWTSSRNLYSKEEAEAKSAGSCLASMPSHVHASTAAGRSQLPLANSEEGRASPSEGQQMAIGSRGRQDKGPLSVWKQDTRLSRLQWGQRPAKAQSPQAHCMPSPSSWGEAGVLGRQTPGGGDGGRHPEKAEGTQGVSLLFRNATLGTV